ncbi:MAG TPA: hypothetical protein VHU80_05180 [Polyangiaceae bacterium]|jgi:hypothetical protein|nr:hypothetical protein [Polyangiaceae bacterium]
MRPVVYDAGVLIAADHSKRRVWAERRVRLEAGQPAAHAAGALLGKTRMRDVVDASVAELSIRKEADIVSDDAENIRRLLSAANARTSILDL